MAVDVLLSFAPRDKEAALELERHLTPLRRANKITLWHRGMSTDAPGLEWSEHAKQAAIILLIVSADLEVDRDEDITEALSQRRSRGARVIPIMWRSVNVKDLRYKDLKMVPEGRAVRERTDRDQAWVEVVQAIRRAAEVIESEGGMRPSSAANSPLQQPASKPTPGTTSTRPLSILFLGANPSDTTRLRLDAEVREIDRRILMGQHREHFQINQAWAATPAELSQTLLRHQPGIVHFSGHGSSKGEILLQDEMGKSAPVGGEVLARLFRLFSGKGLRCVVLNACYSDVQARAIAQHVDCVIGLSGTIRDADALAFAAGFYTGLAGGETVQVAFELGCVQIELLGGTASDRPQLVCRTGINPGTLRLP